MKKLIAILVITFTFSCKKETKQKEALKPLSQIEQQVPDNIKIANASGFDNWDKVTRINFTFNVDSNNNHFERIWTYNPKTNDVTMTVDDKTVAYNRNAIDSTNLKADQAFVNDKYWLLPQFEIIKAKGTLLSLPKKEVAPISKDELNKLTITYGDKGGYTPGDAYDFYYADDYIVKEWVFRKSNAKEPSMMTTFENYEDYNGIKIAKDHKKPEGNWNLYFSNISILTED